MRKSHVCQLIAPMPSALCPKKTIPHVSKRMMVVRMAVAKSELMSCNPTLAKIEVSAAKTADKIAYIRHMMYELRFANRMQSYSIFPNYANFSAFYVKKIANGGLCSSAQKISIRQEQSGQVQETIIEQSGQLESLSLSFYLLPPAR